MEIRTIKKEIKIQASPAAVWEVFTADNYTRQWYQPFSAGAHAITTWQEGSPITVVDDDGNGLTGVVSVSRPFLELAITYEGCVTNGKEDFESEGVQILNGAREIYLLTELPDGTQLNIESDMSDDYYDMMDTAWDKALLMVKDLAERV